VKNGKKTHTCGDLTKKDVGRVVTLMVWVHTRRNDGGIFAVMEDSSISSIYFRAETLR
jgi:aspartyl-tRNA synthetase